MKGRTHAQQAQRSTNIGKFEARLKIPEGDLVLAIDRFNEFSPCQNDGTSDR
jgi:hypothetical protein